MPSARSSFCARFPCSCCIPTSTSLPDATGDCWQLYCPKVLCSILPPGRGVQRLWCISLLFRSFYPESHRILLEDPDLRSCANCCFQVYVRFYGKEFLALFHHIFQEVYDSRHMPRPDAASPLTKHVSISHLPLRPRSVLTKIYNSNSTDPALLKFLLFLDLSFLSLDKSCVICLMKKRNLSRFDLKLEASLNNVTGKI